MERVVVHVWSELSSPRSYLGLRNLIEAARGRKVAIEHHAFIPEIPDTSTDDAREALAALDISVHDAYTHDTRLAQELIYAAKEQGKDPEEAASNGMTMASLINEAALIGGKDISHTDVLVALGAEFGLDASEVRDGLATSRWGSWVDGDLADAGRLRLERAPYMIIAGMFSIEGPSTPEGIAKILETAGAELTELKEAAAEEAEEILRWREENKDKLEDKDKLGD